MFNTKKFFTQFSWLLEKQLMKLPFLSQWLGMNQEKTMLRISFGHNHLDSPYTKSRVINISAKAVRNFDDRMALFLEPYIADLHSSRSPPE